ncbi:Glyoxalase domain-containing protein RDO1, partial [Pseudozyma hubeiensis]
SIGNALISSARPIAPSLAHVSLTQRRHLTIKSLDHLVMTCHSIDQTISFYTRLGMRSTQFSQDRKALSFGDQKINLHQRGKEFLPNARNAQPGVHDLCFVIDGSIDEAMKHLKQQGIAIVEGPVKRTGAVGPITSLYVRDPDENLIELSFYDHV